MLLTIISFLLFCPIVTFLNNNRLLIGYSKMQFSLFLGSPLFWLVLFVSVFITVLPRYLDRVHDSMFRHPEFTMIKE